MKSTGAFITGLIVGMGSRKWTPITVPTPHSVEVRGSNRVPLALKSYDLKEL